MLSSILQPFIIDARNSIFIQLICFPVTDTIAILDQNTLISIPYPSLNCLKTMPFTAHGTYPYSLYIYDSSPTPLPPSGNAMLFDVLACHRTLIVNGV